MTDRVLELLLAGILRGGRGRAVQALGVLHVLRPEDQQPGERERGEQRRRPRRAPRWPWPRAAGGYPPASRPSWRRSRATSPTTATASATATTYTARCRLPISIIAIRLSSARTSAAAARCCSAGAAGGSCGRGAGGRNGDRGGGGVPGFGPSVSLAISRLFCRTRERSFFSPSAAESGLARIIELKRGSVRVAAMNARLVVLVSGAGTNLQALIDACSDPAYGAAIVAVGADRDGIAALDRARAANIPAFTTKVGDFPTRDAWDDALAAACAEYRPRPDRLRRLHEAASARLPRARSAAAA